MQLFEQADNTQLLSTLAGKPVAESLMQRYGGLTNLEGGFPIVIDGICVGAIGVGSGTGAQDCEVARAGLAALGAQAL